MSAICRSLKVASAAVPCSDMAFLMFARSAFVSGCHTDFVSGLIAVTVDCVVISVSPVESLGIECMVVIMYIQNSIVYT